MASRFFHPWEGSRYRTDGYLGKRLLLLGESNYLPPEGGTAQPWMTRSIIEGLAIPQGGGYSDRVLRLVTGVDGPLSRAQREDFWQRVAFCNFIQTALTGPRVRPTPTMWAAGRESLLQTIGELEPQAIWSRRGGWVAPSCDSSRHLRPPPQASVVFRLFAQGMGSQDSRLSHHRRQHLTTRSSERRLAVGISLNSMSCVASLRR